MPQLVQKNFLVNGKRTSTRLELAFWDALTQIAQRENLSIDDICTMIARQRDGGSLSSALRVFTLNYFRDATTTKGHRRAGHGTLQGKRNDPWICRRLRLPT